MVKSEEVWCPFGAIEINKDSFVRFFLCGALDFLHTLYYTALVNFVEKGEDVT